MLNLTKNNVLIASNDYILNSVLYFIKGKKYKIERRLTHWDAYVITSEKKDIHKWVGSCEQDTQNGHGESHLLKTKRREETKRKKDHDHVFCFFFFVFFGGWVGLAVQR